MITPNPSYGSEIFRRFLTRVKFQNDLPLPLGDISKLRIRKIIE